jgi:RHS repeat-associated protein
VLTETQASGAVLHHLYSESTGRLELSYLTINGIYDAFTSYAYDALERVTVMRRFGLLDGQAAGVAAEFIGGFSGAANSVTSQSVFYSYDAWGNITLMKRYNGLAESDLVAATRYGYDVQGRMVSIEHNIDNAGTPSQSAAYTYDPNGNRRFSSTPWQGGAYTTGPDNQIAYSPHAAEDVGATYVYDVAGNLIAMTYDDGGSAAFGWDTRNRLISYTRYNSNQEAFLTVSYAYDSMDRRIAKVVSTWNDPYRPATVVSEVYVWDGDDLLAVLAGSGGWQIDSTYPVNSDASTGGEVVQRYLMGPGQNMVVAEETIRRFFDEYTQEVIATVTSQWALADHLGSVQATVDNAEDMGVHAVGTLVTTDSFGTPYISAGQGYIRMRFTGYTWDNETGLYYANARYYNPRDGRFISKDPLGFDAGDTNVYRYVGNHPNWGRDPSGQAENSILGKLVTISVMAVNAGMLLYHSYKAGIEKDPIKKAGYQNAAALDFIGLIAPFIGGSRIGLQLAGTYALLPLVGSNVPALALTLVNLGVFAKTGPWSSRSNGAASVQKGQSGAQKSIDALQQRGGSKLGQEITIETKSGYRIRLDVYGKEADGTKTLIESKNGPNADISANQNAGIVDFLKNGGYFRGQNAANAKLPIDQLIRPDKAGFQVRIDWWNKYGQDFSVVLDPRPMNGWI